MAFAASGAAAAVGDQKMSNLADMINAVKAEGVANQQAQVTFKAQIAADRASTDGKISALEKYMETQWLKSLP